MKDAAMWKTILILARHTFIRLLWLLLPLGIFAFLVRAIPLSPLQALCGLIPVIVFEVWLVVKYLLPGMSDVVTKTLYASNISTDEEVLVDAARRMLGAGDAAGALELLERNRKENPGMVRPWLMESGLLNDMRRYAESVELLQEGLASRRWRKEDRALFLYKIGGIYSSLLNNSEKALNTGRRPPASTRTRLMAVPPRISCRKLTSNVYAIRAGDHGLSCLVP